MIWRECLYYVQKYLMRMSTAAVREEKVMLKTSLQVSGVGGWWWSAASSVFVFWMVWDTHSESSLILCFMIWELTRAGGYSLLLAVYRFIHRFCAAKLKNQE